MSRAEFVKAAERYYHGQKHQRRGQAYYNYLYDFVNRRAATDLTGSAYDPFYEDSKIDDFLRKLESMGVLR